jgi:hypothetical protein
MIWLRRPLLVLILAVIIVLPGCSACESPSAEIIGEWEAEDWVIDTCAGEIDGKPYLFLMTVGSEGVAKPTIHVLDVGDPAEPVEVVSLETPMEILTMLGGLTLSGTELYLALTGLDRAALWMVDVSDPESPHEIALLECEFTVWNPCISGNYLVVNTDIWGASFAFFDISRPAEPRLLGELVLTPRARFDSNWHADYVGSMFYPVDKGGLAIVDASSPSLPQEVGFYVNPDWEFEGPEGVEGAGTDMSTRIGNFDSLEELFEAVYNHGSFLDVAVSDRYAYVAATDSGLVVLDVRDPESPEEVARLEIPGKAIRVLVAGDFAYIMGVSYTGGSTVDSFRYSVHIMDISDPLAPELVNSIDVADTFPPWQTVIALGDYVYFIDFETVYIIDIYGGHR